MNLRDLEYVVAVAEEEHFGRAASRCNISQPALSGQIIKLEDRLGIKLFERTNRRVALTPVGHEVVEMAKRLLLIADEIETTAAVHADPLAGRIRLGTIPTIGPYLLPSILRPIKVALPKLNLTLAEDVTASLEARLCAGDIDAAVIATPPRERGLDEIPLYDEPFCVAVPDGHPLQNKASVDVRDMDLTELLLLRDGHCLSDQVARLCGMSRTSRPGSIDTQASSLETVIGLVAAGVGTTLLPASSLGAHGGARPGVTVIPAANAEARRRVRLVFRETFPKRQMLAALAAVIGQNLPSGVAACAPG